MQSEEKLGRDRWNKNVADAGYHSDADKLWDAMIAARESNSFGLGPQQLAEDESKLQVFCTAVRNYLGGPAADQAITAGLLTMPRACAWCESESWVWCETCGGCEVCCAEDFHCIHHGCSFGICQCALSEFRDHDGMPPKES
jgi:hypothetical protein